MPIATEPAASLASECLTVGQSSVNSPYGATDGDLRAELQQSESETLKTDGDRESGSKAKLSHSQKLTMVSLSISNLCSSLAFSVIAPFFPQEATNKGATDTEIGLIFGVFQLTICFLAPIYGSVITTVGPKFMYVSGCFTCSVCLVLFGFLDQCPDGPVYIAMCFICRIIEANGTAMLMTASFAIMANQFPNNLSMVMGMLEAFSGIGMMLGPPLGGALYSAGGFRLPFLVVGGILIVSCAVSYFLLPIIHSAKGMGRFLALFKIPKLGIIFFAMFSAVFALIFLDPTLSKHIAKVAPTLDPAQIGGVFLVGCGVYALTAPLVGYICDKGFLMSMLLMGCMLLCAGYMLMGPSPLLDFLFPNKQLWIVILSLIIVGLGVGGALLPTFPLALQIVLNAGYSDNLDTHGLISGFFNCAFSLGAFLGPTAAGAAADAYGFEWAATGCAFLALFVAAVILCTMIVNRIRSGTASTVSVTGSQSPPDYNSETSPLLAHAEKTSG